MTVQIYIEEFLFDEQYFTDPDDAILYASNMQDAGYKVRVK